MNRRKLLGAVGLGATGMAGLLGGGASGAGQDTETTTGTTTTAEGDQFTGIDSSADRPFAEVAVGTREGVRNPDDNLPHIVRVWNDSESARTVELTLDRTGDGEPLLDRAFEFPADGYLTVRLLEPASYRLRVGEGGRIAGELAVPRSRFDCNDSRTDVALTAAGQVKSETVTTEIGCPPEVTARTVTAFAGSCGSANEASVAFADQSVAVEGSIRAPTPCHGARLAGVSLADAETLRLTVATTEPDADVCAQCLATVEYRVDLGFRDRVPETVEVVHAAGDSSETVASATRGAGETTENETTGGTTAGGTTTSEAATDAETTTDTST